MKVPRYSCPRLSDDLGVWDTLYTTDLKVRGYLSSRLPDEFPIVSSIREDNCMIGNRRLEDAVPKANSRGFLNPWVKDGSLEIRLEDGERQRVQGHESPRLLSLPTFADEDFSPLLYAPKSAILQQC